MVRERTFNSIDKEYEQGLKVFRRVILNGAEKADAPIAFIVSVHFVSLARG